MSDHRPQGTTGPPGLSPEHRRSHGMVPTSTGGTGPGWPGQTVDPGDSHDKGELSLCVGEAA